ncbi:2-succinyl-5-enolpyruvyl-6-hydroxy-3-cyclohexene-1-carboxylic-acid synthase [Calothrix sp. 336/3]|uniref:2-succinyl-5-enolpyruvyl-6-hydroxy-3- cyclohexene-1-carboxylic-acid synthase n=1 Tax=Calothrix sp. 336/3 TaxID=1337936 RepID=UPI0004E2F2F4|nr:2-succinyl-5-enolpyruvyl-6-hydroxy-3-cyclohexene-1-carboxylic-acid synthase [Calothrix sp. 336/3]AKG23846.1 2-succinyl-5-enolpyruvyl-6-hydroxy-3-cyclohexene-1-carboxylate synthase [Calothrix sp. 336/3]
MPIGFRNTNELWASVLTQTLQNLGLTTAVICPGSRSTPLAIAFALSPHIEAISILDERSAAFFALGRAKITGVPVALVCTSGTAGANFYPAVIEARESRVPLLILTADRPPELRDCSSGQTIDQVKLYGNYPNWQTELALPQAEMGMLAYLRQMVVYGWERSLFPTPGAVHFNLPFRDPLAPLPDGIDIDIDIQKFTSSSLSPFSIPPAPCLLPPEWQTERGIIIAGVAQPQEAEKYSQAIASLAHHLNFPVLAEALSPVRNYAQLNPNLVSTYDLILRNQQLVSQLTPDIIIQIGALPTSTALRNWLKANQPRTWIIDPSDRNFDPLHGNTTHLRVNITEISPPPPNFSPSPYLKSWLDIDKQVRQVINHTFSHTTNLLESKIPWILSHILPPGTPLFIANSMPVRDMEFFWQPNNLAIQTYCNRGANGIDGTLSTAIGMAHHQPSSVLLTGDLALLHDTNGFLLNQKFQGHLTIILINNNGGGIFEMLPIAQFEPPFEEFFATPQDINFAQLSATYGVSHELITSWEELQAKLNPLPTQGMRILEIPTNRKIDSQWRQKYLSNFARNLSI